MYYDLLSNANITCFLTIVNVLRGLNPRKITIEWYLSNTGSFYWLYNWIHVQFVALFLTKYWLKLYILLKDVIWCWNTNRDELIEFNMYINIKLYCWNGENIVILFSILRRRGNFPIWWCYEVYIPTWMCRWEI